MNIAEQVPEVIPVMHAETFDRLAVSIGMCASEGVGKVFLINHQTHHEQLLENLVKLQAEYPDMWIGVNMLDIGEPSAQYDTLVVNLDQDNYAAAVWSDNAVGSERHPLQDSVPLFGGVSFKYTEHYTDSPEASAELALLAAPSVEVVTTSGPRTGRSPQLDKIKAMKRIINNHPLAIASGITPGNVATFRPFLDYILVASSIEIQPMSGEIDRFALRALLSGVRIPKR